MKLFRNRDGFSAIEALLIIVILGIIGGTGYYVWHSKQSTDKTLANTAKSQPATTTKKTTKSTTNAQTNTTNYLAIKEWGVKIAVKSPIADASYQIVTNNKYLKPSAFLSTKALDNSATCKAYYSKGATADNPLPTFQYIERYALNDTVSLDEGQTDITAVQAASQKPERYKQIANYVYYYGHGNGMPCSEESTDQEDAFQASFATIEAIN